MRKEGILYPILFISVVVEMTVQYVFILIDENNLDFPACVLRKVK